MVLISILCSIPIYRGWIDLLVSFFDPVIRGCPDPDYPNSLLCYIDVESVFVFREDFHRIYECE